MNCPICDYKGLDADAKKCPSCKADLSAFNALDNIHKSIRRQKKAILLLIILFILALVGCLLIYLTVSAQDPSAEDHQKVNDYEQTTNKLQAENQQLKADLEDNKTKLQEYEKKLAERKATPKEVEHQIKEGETLYHIALRYLGDGELYTKIAADNDIKNPDVIRVGSKIIIYY